MSICLIRPTAALRAAFLDMIAEYEAAGETYWYYGLAREDFDAFLLELEHNAQGVDVKPGYVPQTSFWLVEDGTHLLGELRIRHVLNDWLAIEGGHIGYNVRPAERRKGYGTLQLRLGLAEARALGLTRVMLTCDDENTGSARIIEANGGQLAGRVISPRHGNTVRQYWIDL